MEMRAPMWTEALGGKELSLDKDFRVCRRLVLDVKLEFCPSAKGHAEIDDYTSPVETNKKLWSGSDF